MSYERASQRAFIGVSGVVFALSAVGTIASCVSMSAMGGMDMPGGWTMSMAWMRMPGQTWLEAATAFLGMWVVMMAAMMLPSLIPLLWRYRAGVVSTSDTRLAWLTTLVAFAYFFVWTVLGLAAFLSGVTLASTEMQVPALARAAPIAGGAIVVGAGLLQFTTWKARHLDCCRVGPHCGRSARGLLLPANSHFAFRYGLRLGVHCCYCCAGLTAVMLVLGVMDLRAMAAVTTAITLERLLPSSAPIRRVIGALVIAAGLLLTAQRASMI